MFNYQFSYLISHITHMIDETHEYQCKGKIVIIIHVKGKPGKVKKKGLKGKKEVTPT